MAANPASNFTADVEAYIADKTLPLARRQLVAYQFGDPAELPKGRGTTYTATRFNRVPLPYAPLSEAVPPVGQQMTIGQVSAVCQQWGDKIVITDVAEMTIKHPLFQKAIELTALQIAETLERNTFNSLLAGTQINYVNSRGSRAALIVGDVLNPYEITRMYGALATIGAPRFNGDERTDMKIEADAGGSKASSNPRQMPHYTALIHTLVEQDLRQNSLIVTAWSYSDINKLYNYEVGEWNGLRFCSTNMIPTFTGVAQINPTAGTAGSLATGNYFIVVTASDTQNQYESRIYQVSASTAVVGPSGSLTVVLPALSGFTFSVYVGTTSSPTNLGLCTAGPSSGPLQGQATQLAPNQSVVITGLGTAQTPPAAPATGLTIYPTFVFGRGAYTQVLLDDVKYVYLKDADKSDPLNQQRIVGWKCFYGTLISNNTFMGRIESTSAFSTTFG